MFDHVDDVTNGDEQENGGQTRTDQKGNTDRSEHRSKGENGSRENFPFYCEDFRISSSWSVNQINTKTKRNERLDDKKKPMADLCEWNDPKRRDQAAKLFKTKQNKKRKHLKIN